ncbi:Rad52/Rad22 family DNA repair protein [Streptomyces sp. NPDC049879]|uniref:Rad52/Rad22 family DNA repair protein n=1 Tax=Streptomyces sp. NPDC049879 TaxID=3365598 RepID=UPI003799537B
MRLSPAQTQALEAELNPDRISFDYDGNAHVEGWDVRAALTRIFGFGMWSEVITERRLIQERFIPTDDADKTRGNWHVSWAVSILLTCWDAHGAPLGPFEGTTIETGKMPQLGGAHELARKAAATVALKRAAINLGNQFGLSLYRKPPKGAADRRPRTKAVTRTLQPGADVDAAADRAPVEPSVADTEAPATVPDAPAAAVATPPRPEAGHQPTPDAAPAARPGRRPEDVVPKRPVPVEDPAELETARAQLRDLALNLGVDPDAFDAAVVKACGVPLNDTTLAQVRALRAAIERKNTRD